MHFRQTSGIKSLLPDVVKVLVGGLKVECPLCKGSGNGKMVICDCSRFFENCTRCNGTGTVKWDSLDSSSYHKIRKSCLEAVMLAAQKLWLGEATEKEKQECYTHRENREAIKKLLE